MRIRRLGQTDYLAAWEAMRLFTQGRRPDTPDEFWITEHSPVFTLGQAGRPEHLLQDLGIPVVWSDRGGQVTYHGPGQLVIYLLLDLRRRRLKVTEMVRGIEAAIIRMLSGQGLTVNRRVGAPGVYMGADGAGAKIAALGLKVSKGATYHGLSLNVDMDLTPFAAINPCGYPGLAVTSTEAEGLALDVAAAGELLSNCLVTEFTVGKKAEEGKP
ncbi:MAG: lipoyl(octanoyl) transferase LipB [Zoogloeaceae bacterium]|nr:lipoyl(octanoyl) transferase LipB [Zoogloeaceae bacterium]